MMHQGRAALPCGTRVMPAWPASTDERAHRLTAEEERCLARRLERRDTEARHRLIEANLWLVARVARGYARSGVPLSDLVQEGNVGLVQAVDRYDWRKGVPFSPYARLWISHAIRRALPRLRYPIRVPRELLRDRVRLEYLADQLEQQLHRAPTLDELDGQLPRGDLAALRGLPLEPLSLDASHDDGDAWLALDELVPAAQGPDPEAVFLAASDHAELRELLASLGEREREVVILHFGLFGQAEHTFSQLAAQLGLSRQRVQQIEQRALARLRDAALYSASSRLT